jgi:hypothetical protein
LRLPLLPRCADGERVLRGRGCAQARAAHPGAQGKASPVPAQVGVFSSLFLIDTCSLQREASTYRVVK